MSLKRASIISYSLLVLGAGYITDASASTYNWSGTQYTFTQGTITYADALSASVAAGGHLLTFETLEENNIISNWLAGLVPDPGTCDYVPALRCATTQVWLGASDAASEGTWLYTTGPLAGGPLAYSNWFPGEPVNADPLQDSMVFYIYSGQWNDIDDNGGPYILGFVSEVAIPGCAASGNRPKKCNSGSEVVSEVPVPSALPLFASALGGLGLLRMRKRNRAG